jgi:uncharacterized protein with PIN domain
MRWVEIRLYAELAELAGAVEATVPITAPRSVKDAVETCGVPHPEVGLLLVDSEPVGFDHRLEGGERVAVFPPFRRIELSGITTVEPPPVVPRFVLDVHLGTLTRRLRLLGFDCWYRADADDHELASVAVAEERILLTRDRELLMRRVISHGYCPRSDDPDEQALEVVRRFRLDGELAPWTRCVRCNGLLRRVTREEVLELLPPRTRTEFDEFSRCDSCGRVYWPGSHVDAMRGFLDRSATPPPGTPSPGACGGDGAARP